MAVYVNGAAVRYGGTLAGGAQASLCAAVKHKVFLVAGDTVGFYIKTNGSAPTYASIAAGGAGFSIAKTGRGN